MRRFAFHPSAREEFDRACTYFESEKAGLSKRFLDDVYESIGRVVRDPEQWPKKRFGVSIAVTKVFPYKVLYVFDDEVVRIVAVMHQRRRPDYWADRLDSL